VVGKIVGFEFSARSGRMGGDIVNQEDAARMRKIYVWRKKNEEG
jgi:hypothetical protein